MATNSPSIGLVRASDGSGNASIATVQSTRSPGATTISVDTVSGIPTNFYGSMGTPHTFTDPITSEEITVISEATAVDFEGHVDGSDLEIDAIGDGYVDDGSSAGDIVIIKPTSNYANNIADVLEVSHDDDGTLKDGAVDAASVLGTGVVEADKISTGAIYLGHATKTSNQTNNTGAAVQATGLSATINVPTGGRRVKITAFASALQNSSSPFDVHLSIWQGTVGSGTILAETATTIPSNNYLASQYAVAIHQPSAGSVTYNVGFHSGSGTCTLAAAATYPAYLIVELI